jgi:hypothetical protein
MDLIEIQTLIDITQTRVARLTQGTQLELDQHRNFITLMQCIELRSVVSYDQGPARENRDVKGMGFGSDFKGRHNVWTFVFSPDREGVYRDNAGNELGFLIEDVHAVPIIKNLAETINIGRTIFDLKDSKATNTIIRLTQA